MSSIHNLEHNSTVAQWDTFKGGGLYQPVLAHYLTAARPLERMAGMQVIMESIAIAFAFYFIYNLVTRILQSKLAHQLGVSASNRDLFCESCVQMMFYAVSWVIVTNLILQEEWFWTPAKLCIESAKGMPMAAAWYWVWQMYLGWYLFSVYSVVTADVHKNHFWSLLSHHVLTIALLYGSLIMGYWRFGAWVVFSHDVCDVFLHFPKICSYVKNKPPLFLHVPIFLLLPLSWIVFRFGFFPRLIYASVVECPLVVDVEAHSYWRLFNIMLFMLLALQVYWFALIVRVALKKMKGLQFGDIVSAEDAACKAKHAAPGTAKEGALRYEKNDREGATTKLVSQRSGDNEAVSIVEGVNIHHRNTTARKEGM